MPPHQADGCMLSIASTHLPHPPPPPPCPLLSHLSSMEAGQLLSARGPHRAAEWAHLEFCAQLHEVGHVHFIEGGQHGIRVLGALQPLSYSGPQSSHLHTPADVCAKC